MTRKTRPRPSSPSEVKTPESNRSNPVPTDDKYRSFIENLPVLFYAVKPDPPYSPIYVSPAFEMFGYPLEDWVNDPDIWLKVIHEDDRQRVFEETVESTNTGRNAQYEYRVVTADGKIVWLR